MDPEPQPSSTPADVAENTKAAEVVEPVVDVTPAEPIVADATPTLEPSLEPTPIATEMPTPDVTINAFLGEVSHEPATQPGVTVLDVAASTEAPAAVEPALEQPVADPALAVDSAQANNFGAIPPYRNTPTVELSPAELAAIKNDETPAEEHMEVEAEQQAVTEALAEVGSNAANADLTALAVNPTTPDAAFGREDGIVMPETTPAEPVATAEIPVAPVETAQPEPAPEVVLDPTATGAASPDMPAEPTIPGEPPAVTPLATQEEQQPSFISRLLGLVGI